MKEAAHELRKERERQPCRHLGEPTHRPSGRTGRSAASGCRGRRAARGQGSAHSSGSCVTEQETDRLPLHQLPKNSLFNKVSLQPVFLN